MIAWTTIYVSSSWILCIMSFLPSFRLVHWSIRIFDFIRIQILAVLVLLLLAGFSLQEPSWLLNATRVILIVTIAYQLRVILPYITIFNREKPMAKKHHSLSMISVNVYQENNDYQKLIELVKDFQPDILLTIETDKKWEENLESIEDQYSVSKKIPLDNTYGMHFYTRLEVLDIKEHYLISDQRPAIEAHLKDKNGTEFIFWGVHPPPPSPTEKETSLPKDAELLKIAKRIKNSSMPTLIIGDFNNVCWSISSKLFMKVSGLLDARVNRGMHSTFPVKPRFLRFPIDLLFHSKSIIVNEIKTLNDIGSDHLPFSAFVTIRPNESTNDSYLDEEEEEEVDEIINKGEVAE